MTALAVDPALPQRDVLLNPVRMAPVLERRLGVRDTLELTRCEVARATYRVAESLRVRYTVEAGGRVHEVACRAFPRGRGVTAYRRALGRVVAPVGELRPVGWEPELETVFWTFPNDRKLRIGALAALPDILGPELRGYRLVAYAPEKAATVRCDGGDGPLAYAKLYAHEGAARVAQRHRRLGGAGLLVPRALGVPFPDLLLLAPLAGRPLASLTGEELVAAHRALGTAVARLHELPAVDGARFRQLDADHAVAAASVLARVRPDAGPAARRVAAAVGRRRVEEGVVCVHGDLHPKNVLLGEGGIGLVDLDQTAGGAASDELGSLLASLRAARVAGSLAPVTEHACAEALADGYAAVRRLPPAAALRTATAAALLVERALRAVTRVRAEGLAVLPALLAEAQGLLDA